MAQPLRIGRYVARYPVIQGGMGVRISAGGRRFRIDRAVVWNLVDDEGAYRGQAASFAVWDGGNREVGPRKSWAPWVPVRLAP